MSDRAVTALYPMNDDSHAAAGVRQGEILAGKYRIDRILGVGGMGVVVAAHHIGLDEKVAIKFLLPETLSNQEAVARFSREARAAVKIKSEHVARVSDVGTLDNGAPYMVMEYLEGGDLSAWLRQRGTLPVEQAVEFVLQACEAVAEAHALGMVHRDLKPANLFVSRRADNVLSVKVLDFGISKATGLVGSGGDASLTRTAALMGSPLYMSPEQMQSARDVDARADIWALGVTLYELLAGVPPFQAETMPELVLRVFNASPAPLRSLRPDAPGELEAVLIRCLEKDRGRRFQTVGELAVALLQFAPKRAKSSVERISGVMHAAGLSGAALALPPSSDEHAPVPIGVGTAASWGATNNGKARSPKLAFGVAVAVVALGVTAVFLRRPRADVDAPAAQPSAPPSPRIAAAAPVPPAATLAREAPGDTPPLVPANALNVVPTPTADAPDSSGNKHPPSKSQTSRPPVPVVTSIVNSPAEVTPVPGEKVPSVSQRAATTVPPPRPSAISNAAAAASVNPSCNPTFYFDAQGNKRFKPECFH